MGIVEEESDESTGWIELIADAGLISRAKVESLLQESNELTAITVASIKTARQNTRGK
jgi:four helix bundle protein